MTDLLTVKQVAELLQLSETTVRRYIKGGKLEAVRIGRNVRVPRRAVKALMALSTSNAFRESRPIYRTSATQEMTATYPPTSDALENGLYRIFQKIAQGAVDLDDEGDELLKLAGALSSNVSDIASRHDDYIGETIRSDAV